MKWCILRTSPAQTLALAEAMNNAGIKAWTPTEFVKPEPRKLEPWEKPVRRQKPLAKVTRPLLPTFVFADADRIKDLAEMSHSPVTGYTVWDEAQRRYITKRRPFFTLFAPDRKPIPDSALAPLRRIASNFRKPRHEPLSIKAGDHVRLTEGAYEGLRGEVLSVSGQNVRVQFPGGHFSFVMSAQLLLKEVDAQATVQLKES